MRILLVHDTRTVGFLTAVVLKRIFARQGHEVEILSGRTTPRLTIHAKGFWSETAAAINPAGFDRIVLSCITFYEDDPDLCASHLRGWASAGLGPSIYSHRWPDGYQRLGYEVAVPPFDVLEGFPRYIEPVDRELLRLSFIVSREANPESVTETERDFADRLAARMAEKPEECWERLVEDPDAVLREVRDNPSIGAGTLAPRVKLEQRGEGFELYEIDPSLRVHAEKTLQNLVSRPDCTPGTLGLGHLVDGGEARLYVVRRWTASNLPSVQYLLERNAERYGLPGADAWLGRQDAKNLPFARARLRIEELPQVKVKLVDFARATALEAHGQRAPAAGLAHRLHHAATEALKNVDLLRIRSYGDEPALRFLPEEIRIAREPGNRRVGLRDTLILPLQIASAEAAAFLFGAGGYNLDKLERLVEGVLIGMGRHRSIWLECTAMPDRLRIDTRLSEAAIRCLPDALNSVADVSPVAVEDAIRRGLLDESSTIARAMRSFHPNGGTLIVYRGSETIGPSVPYALAASALARALQSAAHPVLAVLDLFSGSGLSARAVLDAGAGEREIFAVDLSIAAGDAGVDDSNIVWLKTDAWQVVRGREGQLDRRFDLVCMDPPHGALFELLFKKGSQGRTMLEEVSRLAPWIVVYQGHASQVGRGEALQAALEASYARVTRWQIGPEMITVAGPEEWERRVWSHWLSAARNPLERDARDYGWAVEELVPRRRSAAASQEDLASS